MPAQSLSSKATNTKRIVKVAIPCPLYRTFDYRLKAEYKDPIQPGLRVRVPFGSRNVLGMIIEEVSDSEITHDKLKSVISVLDEKNLLGAPVLQLLLWAARYYAHPLGEVLQTALPVYLRHNEDTKPPQDEYWQILFPAFDAPSIQEETLKKLKSAPKQRQLLQLLLTSGKEGMDAKTLNERIDNWRPAAKALIKKRLIQQIEKPSLCTLASITSQQTEPATVHLNEEQKAAISSIIPWLHQHAVHLIDGITGSGKTEIYLALCESILASGKQVLLLVPEIGLTPQLTQRFLQRLNARTAVIHSAMSDNQRYAAWHAAANQQAQLLIGTRSAVFTPLPELGLIIIDEEHDSSYKQQDGFRYNARDLAIVRAKHTNIPVILGSATPALETLHNSNVQRYKRHYLRQRANNKPLPGIKLINLCNQKLHEGLAESLLLKIRQHLEQKGQVLLFINRRGFAPLLMCHHCGWTTNCHRCDAHMTYHKRRHQLHCHHCGSQRRAPESCENCGSEDLLAIGAGTERIEQYLTDNFPSTHVNRIDRDTTRNKGSLEKKLKQAHSGECGILVGTQMLAKGHDFPNITLVCILDTDQALFSADFRAAEHLAQQITQVSGRAGRADKAGEVLIQTHHPDHPLLQTLIHNGYSAFADAALKERKTAGLPPARRLALLRCESVAVEDGRAFLEQAKELAQSLYNNTVDLFGPLPAPMERRAGRYRYQLMLQADERKGLHQLINSWAPLIQQLPEARKVRWSLDIDPYDTY